jgi:hypothetical protein
MPLFERYSEWSFALATSVSSMVLKAVTAFVSFPLKSAILFRRWSDPKDLSKRFQALRSVDPYILVKYSVGEYDLSNFVNGARYIGKCSRPQYLLSKFSEAAFSNFSEAAFSIFFVAASCSTSLLESSIFCSYCACSVIIYRFRFCGDLVGILVVSFAFTVSQKSL